MFLLNLNFWRFQTEVNHLRCSDKSWVGTPYLMHGNSNENQRNNMIDPPHLGKSTLSFLFSFLLFWGGAGGGQREGSHEVRHGPF